VRDEGVPQAADVARRVRRVPTGSFGLRYVEQHLPARI
jgi:hypothetical protein